MHTGMVCRRGFVDIWPLLMRSVAWTMALESGQTMVGLSASMIQWAHWSIALAAELPQPQFRMVTIMPCMS
jgi:hypothetical protein